MSGQQGPLPIKFAEVVNLAKLGIDSAHIKFNNINMQSSKFVCVREEGANSVAVVDTGAKMVNRFPAKAIDSAIMHPQAKVIGFRQGPNLQIFNLDTKTKVKATVMQQTVVFWKWLDPTTIGIVTDSSVYHWKIDKSSVEPTKVFDRAASDGPVQILNYQQSPDTKWLLLQGISGSSSSIKGVLQLYSVERSASQPPIDATAGTFASVKLPGKSSPSTVFCFVSNTPAGPKFSAIELSAPKDSCLKVSGDLKYAVPSDFCISMHSDNERGTLFLLTRGGYLFLYEISGAKCIFAKKVSQATMFTSISHTDSGGIVTVDQSGRVIHIALDSGSLVPYLSTVLKDPSLAIHYATNYGLGGADDMFQQQFNQFIALRNIPAAAKCAAEAPNGALRTRETVAAFNSLQGTPPPVLQYFSLLLKTGKLRDFESIELARLVISSGAPAGQKHLTEWIAQDKLEHTEALGDTLRGFDVKLACSVYLRASCPAKAVGCLLQLGEFQRILDYSKSVGFSPDYPLLLGQLHRAQREKAREFAGMLAKEGLVDVNHVVDTFMQASDAESTTSFLLDVLQSRGDRAEDAELQTRLLEINLAHSPQVADAILESDQYSFSHFDRLRVAQMCERVHLLQRALEFYDQLEDKKRVLLIGLDQNLISPEFVLNYFGEQTAETTLECLRDLLRFNLQQHIRLVVEVAKRYSDQLSAAVLISLFEEFDAHSGLYYYLGSFVNYTQDPDLVLKYVQAAVQLGQLKVVERICRENDYYEPVELKEYLLRANLKDPRPLIHVCDRHDFIDELTRFLYHNNMFAFIEAYTQKMNQAATPKVIGSLLDLNADDDKIRTLLQSIRPGPCPVGELVEEVLKRNRLRLLLPWLEARRHEGSEDTDLHNGLAMCYVEINSNPQHFLASNRFYDSKVVGEFCESRDPHLSFIAYQRGHCDQELIAVTNKNGFFKDQARYLVERQSPELWAQVLVESNEHRRHLIDQVVASALPESRVPDQVSCTVKAFMDSNLPNELIELLEKIVLHGPVDGEFRRNRNLQNLLILTAIKADPPRVMDYLNRLDNYDGPDIAKIAASPQYQLFEEAFFIYKKFEHGQEAIKVLLEGLNDLARATEFAEYLDKPKVWGILAHAQLADGDVHSAIESFLKAGDITSHEAVISAAQSADAWAELIPFLELARTKLREASIDNELLYAIAKTNALTRLEQFLHQPHLAKVEHVADRLFDESLYQPARILFEHIKQWGKLALCYVHLEEYQPAVDAARKANQVDTWKAVCYACVDAHEFRLAQACGVHIIVFMDHLGDLLHHYELGGHFEQVIALMEQGINLDRAHQGIFTQLGVLYAKYREGKLMEHIKLFWNRLNIPILLTTCRQNLHWKECVFLLTHYDQYENACDTMMQNSTDCWEHDLFKSIIKQVPNSEVYYRALSFYLEEHPLLLNDLLIELSSKLDHARVVAQVQRLGHIQLLEKYLLFVQKDNLAPVNEALNQLFIEQQEYAKLRESIDLFPAFDQIMMAKRIQDHKLLEFRRIAAYIYKINKRFQTSVELSKADNHYADVIQTSAESKTQQLAEETLSYFIGRKQHACFAATLYACYSVIRADVALELAWTHNLYEMIMPFMIQVFRDYNDKLESLENRFVSQDQDKEKEEAELKAIAEAEAEKAARFVGIPTLGSGMNAPLALPAAPGFGGPPQPQYGFPPQLHHQQPPRPYGGGF